MPKKISGFSIPVGFIKHKSSSYNTTGNTINGAVDCDLSRSNDLYKELCAAEKHKLIYKVVNPNFFFNTCIKQSISIADLCRMKNIFDLNGEFQSFLDNFEKVINEKIEAIRAEIAADKSTQDRNESAITGLMHCAKKENKI